MSLVDRVRKLEREAEGCLVAIPQTDGVMKRFHEDAVLEAVVFQFDRGRALYQGEPREALPPPHPLVEALRGTRDLDGLVRTHGTCLEILVGEEEIFCGERERPGPPVKWNESGTVCE